MPPTRAIPDTGSIIGTLSTRRGITILDWELSIAVPPMLDTRASLNGIKEICAELQSFQSENDTRSA